eukprot:gene3943-6406_t
MNSDTRSSVNEHGQDSPQILSVRTVLPPLENHDLSCNYVSSSEAFASPLVNNVEQVDHDICDRLNFDQTTQTSHETRSIFPDQTMGSSGADFEAFSLFSDQNMGVFWTRF